MRDATGNPQIKARVRQIQRAMRRRRIKADISRASVLITNPTHYAVALEFSFETMQAPTVLAKGRDLQAAEMREDARWAGVPIVENPPLARSLYQSVEEGRSIPFELYQAIAGILAFLYRQKVEERMRADRQAKANQGSHYGGSDDVVPNNASTNTPSQGFTGPDRSNRDESTGDLELSGRRSNGAASPKDARGGGPGTLPLLAGPEIESARQSAGGAV